MTRTKRKPKIKSLPCYADISKGEGKEWIGTKVRINKFFRVDERMKDLAPKLELDSLGWEVVEVRRYLPFPSMPITLVCQGHGYSVEVYVGDVEPANKFLGLSNLQLITKVRGFLAKKPTKSSKQAIEELTNRLLYDRESFTDAQQTRILESVLLPVGRTVQARATDIVQRIGTKGMAGIDRSVEDVNERFQNPVFVRRHEVGNLLNYVLTLRGGGHRSVRHPVIKKVIAHWKEFAGKHKWAAISYADLICEIGWMSNSKEFNTAVNLLDKTMENTSNGQAILIMASAMTGAYVGLDKARTSKVQAVGRRYKSKILAVNDGEFYSNQLWEVIFR